MIVRILFTFAGGRRALKPTQEQETKAAKAAAAKQQADLKTLETEIGTAGSSALQLAERCAKAATIRLAAQPEAVRVAAVNACVGG